VCEPKALGREGMTLAVVCLARHTRARRPPDRVRPASDARQRRKWTAGSESGKSTTAPSSCVKPNSRRSVAALRSASARGEVLVQNVDGKSDVPSSHLCVRVRGHMRMCECGSGTGGWGARGRVWRHDACQLQHRSRVSSISSPHTRAHIVPHHMRRTPYARTHMHTTHTRARCTTQHARARTHRTTPLHARTTHTRAHTSTHAPRRATTCALHTHTHTPHHTCAHTTPHTTPHARAHHTTGHAHAARTHTPRIHRATPPHTPRRCHTIGTHTLPTHRTAHHCTHTRTHVHARKHMCAQTRCSV
jgi:hypothetical protein